MCGLRGIRTIFLKSMVLSIVYILRRCVCLLLGLALSGIAWAGDYRFNLRDFGIKPEAGLDNAMLMAEALRTIKTKVSKVDHVTLVLDPGVYEFGADSAPKRTFYISNHDHVPERSVGLLLEGFSSVKIEGNGAELRFLDRMLPIAIVASDEVTLEGISIDFCRPQISEVRIVENRGDGGIVFTPSPWVQWRISSDGSEFECFGRDWSNRPYTGIAFEGNTGRLLYRTADLSLDTKGSLILDAGLIHAPAWRDDRLIPGSVVALRTYDRPQPAIFVDASRRVTFKDVAIHYADGMGLLAQNSRDITLDGLRVLPKEGSGKYSTTQADATHFSGCSGHIDVRRGVFEGMMDDAINVHGVYLKLVKRIDDYTVEAQYMHPQAFGMEWGISGDSIQFVASSTFEIVGTGNNLKHIVSAEEGQPTIGAKRLRLTFEEPLPGAINESVSIGIENLSKTPSVTFARNVIRHNRARGTLLNTPKPIIVEHNIFDHISGAAILVSSDCNQWFESGQTRSMAIRNNLFYDVLTSVYQFTEAVISLYPVIPNLEHQTQPFYGDGADGIIIENNSFMTFDTPLLFAQSVDGIVWRNNKVFDTRSYPRFHWNQEPFILRGSRGFVSDVQ